MKSNFIALELVWLIEMKQEAFDLYCENCNLKKKKNKITKRLQLKIAVLTFKSIYTAGERTHFYTFMEEMKMEFK